MLLVIASDMVNRMSIPGLMECLASDYAESPSRKYGHANRHLLLCAILTYCQYCTIAKPDIGGPQFRHRATFLLPGCNASCYIAYNTYGRIHETATIAKRPSQHWPSTSCTGVCFAITMLQ